VLPSLFLFLVFCRTFRSGGTRIRTGDTMIFRSVPNPTVNPRRVPRAESKRFLEVTDRREPPLNAGNRHGIVVALWWAQRGGEADPRGVVTLSITRGSACCLRLGFTRTRLLRRSVNRGGGLCQAHRQRPLARFSLAQ
jgi:hypothetical protein